MTHRHRTKVLIVDDDEQVVRFLKLFLESQGCLCICAYSGAQGQCRFLEEEIDVIVTDLHMDLGDGISFIRAVRRRSQVPVIITSGFTGQYAGQMHALGEVTVMPKPVDTAELMRTVRRYCPAPPRNLQITGSFAPSILIADDDTALIYLLKAALGSLGAEITDAQDAISALLAVHESPPDLVILDVNMPAGNGLSVCEMLATDPGFADTPVIIFTGEGSHARVRAVAMGAHYVQKGVDAIAEVARLASQLISDMRSEVTKSQLYIG
jgi:CheY-like chemotaxis protein